MAPASAPRPGRLLAIGLLVLVGLYALLPVTATKPKLGLDLRGGTSVTLKPKAIGGQQITNSALDQAVETLRKRVDALGVAESEVTTEGNNIVISVPGKGRNDLLDVVGSTAELRFRHVLQALPGSTPAIEPTPSGSPRPSGSATPAPRATATLRPSATTPPSAKPRVLGQALLAAPAPTPTPTPTVSPSRSAGPAASASPTPTPTATVEPELTLAQMRARLVALDCSTPKARQAAAGADIPGRMIVACDDDGATKYLLDKAAVAGKEIKSASATFFTTEWQVVVDFKGNGAKQFGTVTAKAAKLPDITAGCGPPDGCNAVAIVLDGIVESAPRINDPNGILGGSAQITGDFTKSEAQNLADVLKFGALPLAFERQNIVSISATLGQDQLDAGLLAGAIGLALVVVFSLLYYRGLGVITILSLALAGAFTYALVSILGDVIDFTLSLAGIAGLIVAIGITADSFVVYFERLRDEVREGRTLRSAAERGWDRAKRTILVAGTVSFLAAAILYWLSVGSVRGFAFTLGLSTLIDIFIVFTFTHPIISLLVRTKLFGSGKAWTGLSADRLGARALVPAAATAGAPTRPHRRPPTEG